MTFLSFQNQILEANCVWLVCFGQLCDWSTVSSSVAKAGQCMAVYSGYLMWSVGQKINWIPEAWLRGMRRGDEVTLAKINARVVLASTKWVSRTGFWAAEMGNSREVSLVLSFFISRQFRAIWMWVAVGHSLISPVFLWTSEVPGTVLSPREMTMNKETLFLLPWNFRVKSRCNSRRQGTLMLYVC